MGYIMWIFARICFTSVFILSPFVKICCRHRKSNTAATSKFRNDNVIGRTFSEALVKIFLFTMDAIIWQKYQTPTVFATAKNFDDLVDIVSAWTLCREGVLAKSTPRKQKWKNIWDKGWSPINLYLRIDRF